MARPQHEAAAPSALAPALLRFVGASHAELLAERAGLETSDAERDDVPITSTQLATMLAVAADLSNDRHLALRLPSELVFRKYDAGALAARVAATPRRALEAVARYAPLVFPRLEVEIADGFAARIAGAPRGLGWHVDEFLLATALAHCRRGGTTIVPVRATLTSARPPGDLAPLLRALGTDEIEFGAECTSFVLAPEDLARPLPAFDPMLVAAAEHLASAALRAAPRTNALAPAVAAKIEALMPKAATAEVIAKELRMSARTLQRRLEDEGVRFSQLCDEVRERVAKKLLADQSQPLAEIAYRVGFGDLATFSRAFKRWTGTPPGAYRRRVE